MRGMTQKRARTETFEHTISGLLTKRADLFGEAASSGFVSCVGNVVRDV